MKYIKKFNQHSLYEAYIVGAEFIKPNLSLCVQEDEVHYNRYIPIHQVDFIESSGSNHIIIPLTHFPVLSNTNDKYFKIYVKFQMLDHGSDCNDGQSLLHIHCNRVDWNYNIYDSQTNIHVEHIFDKQNNWKESNYNYVNEHIIYEHNEYTWLQDWHLAKLYLFCWFSIDHNAVEYHSISRLYELKIWDNNDNLIMHLVPYKNESTNVTYIHDNITNNDYYFE